MKRLPARATHMLLHPSREWQVIRNEESSYRTVLFRYAAVLACIPPLAAVAGRLIFDRHIQNSSLGSTLTYIVVTNSVWYCMYVLNVMIVGAILTLVINSPGSRVGFREGLQISAYSFTPLCIAGCIAVIPKMGWIMDAAIVYSVYLLFLGIVVVAGIVKQKAFWYALGTFFSAAVIVGIINFAEYVVESQVGRIMR
jgi:hypothetical protein